MDNPETLKRKRECSDNEGPTSSRAKKTKLSYGNSEPRGSNEKRKLAYDAYTVGWICVLRSELNASRALLDEEHDRLPPANNDDNSYLLGRMGEHNIVIAFPGSGTYGMSAASQTATNMVRTFRNIRFGLMVGVGGGAPKHPDPNDPLRDIRLGDVIVSIPKGSHGGVLQYDVGKWKDDSEFHIESHLDKPPKILTKAIELLQSDHDFGEGKMKHYIDEVAIKSMKLPGLRDYRFPGRDQDQLFKSDYLHTSGDNCSACDTVQVEKRLSRNSDDPVIHYGLIASGNAVMRSAERRDKLRDAWGVICFEMEAAGLMDDFPCVVIRGICDYSDGHKHKLWQPYGAVVAAAYAKDLLRVIQPQEVESLEEAAKMIKQVLDSVSTTREKIEEMKSNLDRKEDFEILNWITPIDYAPQQSDLISRRQEGTGQWLLDSPEFQAWLKPSKQTLFCPGIPGAGKTIITAIVVDNLCANFQDDPNVGIAYVYCSFKRNHEQKLEDLLLSLLKQLAQGQSAIPNPVKQLYDRHKSKNTPPSLDEISRVLHSVTALYSKVFIIVDALDECQVIDKCRTRFLSEIFDIQAKCNTRLFATSRFIPEIMQKFEGSRPLEICASPEDVRRYLESHMSQLPAFVGRNLDLQEEIKLAITGAIDGMFLLAQLYLNSLIGKRSPKAIKTALQNLREQSTDSNKDNKTKALYNAYEETMDRIERQNGDSPELAKEALSWITFAKRPLTTLELQDAMAVEINKPELDKDNLPDIDDIVSVCAGLVTVDEESHIIRLVHYTTQEYFERTQEHWFPDTETSITKICVTYLSFSVFESGFCRTDDEFEKRLQSYQLYNYAAQNWGYHAREASTVYQEVINFLKCKAKVQASSQALMATKQYSSHSNYSQKFPRQITGLHLTAYFGADRALSVLLEKGVEADLKDEYSRTPLSYAAKNGHEAIVKLLLAREGVDADSKGGYSRTPLWYAAANGHEAIVKLLLAREGVDADSKGWDSRTPLSYAAADGHEAIVKLLLAREGVDANSKDWDSRTPLWYAAADGHEAIVKLLLAREGVDADSKDEYSRTPLSHAAEDGHEAIVKLLLAREGVDADSKGWDSRTPLSYTAANGHEAIVKLLLAREGVDANSKDKYSRTPLLYAAANGHEAIVKLLLAREGVDADSKNKYSRTPLSYAAANGHEAIIKLLEQGTEKSS